MWTRPVKSFKIEDWSLLKKKKKVLSFLSINQSIEEASTDLKKNSWWDRKESTIRHFIYKSFKPKQLIDQ